MLQKHGARFRVTAGLSRSIASRRKDPPADQFHDVTFSESLDRIDILNSSKDQSPELANAYWNTLVKYEDGEYIPMPPYRLSDNNEYYRFLHPLAIDDILYQAKLTIGRSDTGPSVLDEVLDKAIKAGMVKPPVVSLLVNCTGLRRILEHTDVAHKVPVGAFGFFSDGEICQSSRQTNKYRNWTTAALVVGHNFNPQYLDALLRIYQKHIGDIYLASKGPGTELWRQLIKASKVLAQADWIHIRIADDKTGNLINVAGTGELY